MIKGLPFVSVCTPTFNRRPFIPIMLECFKNQTYPKQNIEWIIADDGTDSVEDIIKSSGIDQIRYFRLPNKMTLGKKRNFIHTRSKGDILVYMDDDDYYPPERISHAVQTLLKHPEALCGGSSEIYTYFKNGNSNGGKMIRFGPYGPNHATAATFAFRKELLNQTQYNDIRAIGEEREFLKDYTIPFVQFDPLKTILVFSHNHNTFDKRKMLEKPDPRCVNESSKTVDDFIRQPFEQPIKSFFLEEIDGLLKNYREGESTMKPDVLEQIKEIEERRFQQQNSFMMLSRPGEPPVPLSQEQVAQFIQQMQNTIQQQQQCISQLQEGKIIFAEESGETISLNHTEILNRLKEQQIQLSEKDAIIQHLQKQLLHAKLQRGSKTEPEVKISI